MAEVITSGKVIQKPEIVLEQDDFLPPGLMGVRTVTREEAGRPINTSDTNEYGEDGGGTVLEPPPVIPPGGTWPDGTALPIPTTFRIVSQTMRILEDRTIKVDVEIETDDFPGITQFEARWNKD